MSRTKLPGFAFLARDPVAAPTAADSHAISMRAGASTGAGNRNFPDRQAYTRLDALIVTCLVFLCVLSWYPRRHGPLDLRWDGSVYYVLGTSLAQGEGYRLLNEPGHVRANQYPPLLPAVIAASQKLAGTSDPFVVGTWLKQLAVLGSMFVAAGTYLLLRHFLPPLWATCGGVMSVLAMSAYLYYSMLATELPFTVAFVTFLLAYYRLRGVRREITTALAAAAAFLFRTVGIVVYAAWIGDAVLRRQYRTAALRLLTAAVCVIPWYAYVHAVERSPEYRQPAYAYQRADYVYPNVSYSRNMAYIDPFRPERGRLSSSDLLHRLTAEVWSIPAVIGETVTSYRNFWIGHGRALRVRTGVDLLPPVVIHGLLVLIGCIVLTGVLWLAFSGEYIAPLCLLGTIAVIGIAPWPEQRVRYFSTSLPILLLGLLTSAYTLQRMLAGRRRTLGRVASTASMCLIGVIVLEQALAYYQAHTEYLIGSYVGERGAKPIVYKQLFYDPDQLATDECITWIEKHTAPGDVIAASMAHWVFLRTGRKAVIPPLEADAAKANQLLDSVPARYVIRDGPKFFSSRYVAAAIQSDRAGWRLVYTATADDAQVYERVRR